MSATNIGLNGRPVKFLGAYVKGVTTNLGLAQSPSTATVTLAEDLCSSPPVLFQPPRLGQFVVLNVGSNFQFCGVVTKYDRDISNISGKYITVNISDPREIMKTIPLILAPGFRAVASKIKTESNCSVIDAFGAFDSEEFGINVSSWNQSGMTYDDIKLALEGGAKVITGAPQPIQIPAQGAKAFGEKYNFDMSEVTAKVTSIYRVNTNLINMADFIQELSNKHSFDWFIESIQLIPGADITIKIKLIDRSQDNVDIDLQKFLDSNADRVISARSGVELRNDIACGVILGAPVEVMKKYNIDGMANNILNLSDFGGSKRYLMEEDEMRAVLASKSSWRQWVSFNGGWERYSVSFTSRPLISVTSNEDNLNQLGVNKDAVLGLDEDTKNKGKLYERLKGHSEATYGKRFLYTSAADFDAIDAAWTLDVVAGTVVGPALTVGGATSAEENPNEFFRNDQGKTRAYIQYEPSLNLIDPIPQGLLGFAGSFVIGKGAEAAQPTDLALKGQFDVRESLVEVDKSDYMIDGESIFVAATIEEGNIIKIDSPVVEAEQDILEFEKVLKGAKNDAGGDNIDTADGVSAGGGSASIRRTGQVLGALAATILIHGKAYQPTFAFVPSRAKYLRYGPIFSSNVQPTSEGKLSIEQDDGFAPWEFGTTSIMLDAMQFKVDNESSDVREIQTADINVEGFPKFSIGESLGRNSNINSINISFGGQVTTTYRLQSFQRKFGELSKDELASLSLFARRGGSRTFPQNSLDFIERFRTRVQKQFGGIGSTSTSSISGGANSFE